MTTAYDPIDSFYTLTGRGPIRPVAYLGDVVDFTPTVEVLEGRTDRVLLAVVVLAFVTALVALVVAVTALSYASHEPGPGDTPRPIAVGVRP